MDPTVESKAENFQEFFEKWTIDQDQHLEELMSAFKSLAATKDASDPALSDLVNRVVKHYEEYYKAKSCLAKQNVLLVLSPPWITKLEDAFLWIGGWRPSMAFHLLYSKSGLQLEASLTELAQGVRTGDLGDLRPSQIHKVDELQMKTIKEERLITEKMAKQQETVVDPEIVELTHEVTQLLGSEGEGAMEGKIQSTLKDKEEGIEMILGWADDLRLRTLTGVIEILSPQQALHFLIAAAELHLRLHQWGKDREEGLLNHL